MSQLFIDWSNGRVERLYRGARTVRFVQHMRPESIQRLQDEISQLANKGYHPTKYSNGWLYQKGAVAA